MKLTYKTTTLENEDTDFQFYDRLLTRTSDKSSRPPKAARSTTCTSTFLPDYQVVHVMGEAIQVKKYLNTQIDDFYKVNAATLNFNPTEWLDLNNHSDPKMFGAPTAQRETGLSRPQCT